MAADLILFAGQSNMAGRGSADEAPCCDLHMGREFRAVSDPGALHPIREPFGVRENRPGGLDDGERKTGGLVSAFVREYFVRTGHEVVAVSASKGGSSSGQWVRTYAADAAERLERAREYLDGSGIPVLHTYVVWSQGETDGDHGVSAQRYRENFAHIWETLKAAGAERCFLIRTGHFNYVAYPDGVNGMSGREIDGNYEVIRRAQTLLCAGGNRRPQEERTGGAERAGEADAAAAAPGQPAFPDVFLASGFETCLHLMKDPFHYRQQAYNRVGAEAARTAAELLLD